MLTDFATDEKTVLRLALRRMAEGKAAVDVREILAGTPIWRDAASIALYVSLPGEVDSVSLLNLAWGEGKTVFLPKITHLANRQMEFFPIANIDQLQPGPFNLKEPPAGTPARAVDLLLVPGVAFDRRGYRLGHGGGFYDRFLAEHADFAATRIGLCASWQLLARLPNDSWDLPMNGVCTEEELLWS